MNDINDFDLDVLNALKLFPKTDEDCYLYCRGKIDFENKIGLNSFISMSGIEISLSNLVYSLLKGNPEFKGVVFNAVFNLLMEDESERTDLITFLREELQLQNKSL